LKSRFQIDVFLLLAWRIKTRKVDLFIKSKIHNKAIQLLQLFPSYSHGRARPIVLVVDVGKGIKVEQPIVVRWPKWNLRNNHIMGFSKWKILPTMHVLHNSNRVISDFTRNFQLFSVNSHYVRKYYNCFRWTKWI